LGTNSPPDSLDFQGNWGWQGEITGDGQGSFPMFYDYFKFHETVSRMVFENFYIGIGYQLDYYWNIKDEQLNLDTVPSQVTPHWLYSRKYDFDTSSYMLSGLSLNVVYDSRDNLINPYKGFYANLNYRINQEWLGSDQFSTNLWAEFRTYIGLSKKKPRHVVGFWLFGDFQVSGNRPYLTLMASGEDQKARSGRGYIAGRFRGENFVYGEVEYRFPISQCSQVLGGVIYVNATTASNLARENIFYDSDGNILYETDPVRLFQYVMPAFGFGLRFMINKYTRLNLNLDFGLGIKSRAFYFSGTETF
jgi:outer membrane protein assembly factor BamA